LPEGGWRKAEDNPRSEKKVADPQDRFDDAWNEI
jgi:hypothetical protein